MPQFAPPGTVGVVPSYPRYTMAVELAFWIVIQFLTFAALTTSDAVDEDGTENSGMAYPNLPGDRA